MGYCFFAQKRHPSGCQKRGNKLDTLESELNKLMKEWQKLLMQKRR